jgi:hypothetical protein
MYKNIYICFLVILAISNTVLADDSNMYKYAISQLVAQSINANVTISKSESLEAEIKISGHKNIIEKFKIKNEEGIVSIEQPDNLILTDSQIPNIEILMPQSTPMKLGITSGKWHISDTDADLDILIVGSANVNIGNSRGQLNISVVGNADIIIDNTIGNVDIELNGSANVNIKSGEIPLLITSIQGSGNVIVNSEVKDGEFSLIGTGSIIVNKLRGNVSRNEIIGNGKISYM